MNITDNDNTNTNNAGVTGHNIFSSSPSLNDTLDQQSNQKQRTLGINGNATVTEPIGAKGLLKLEYNLGYLPSLSIKNTYIFSRINYRNFIFDTPLSSSFSENNTVQKAGSSYLYRTGEIEASVGLYYQFTSLRNENILPQAFVVHQNYKNMLPIVTFLYKFSKTKNLHCSYSASTQEPSANQLQNVVNNTDPLHLTTGNPLLLQTYQNNISCRYNASHKDDASNFSISVNGGYTLHTIASNTLIALRDTIIGERLVLPKGSQITMPVNINGSRMLNTNLNFGVPLQPIKCRLGLSINAGINYIPSIVNSEVNFQKNKNLGLGANISSNINEKIDFMISSNATMSNNSNSLNTQLNNSSVTEDSRATFNFIFWNDFVFNTALTYQMNAGISSGYNQNYLLWNVTIGKKIFKNHLGDIRLSAFDVFNQNSNITHIVSDTYIQDQRINAIQRYVLLTFTYKLRDFKK